MSTSCAGVIASFNQRNYISEAVMSLLGQVDELIVVDDQSTDGTFDLLIDLAKTHKTLKIIRKENRLGVSRAFNLAVQSTDCEVILIQGGDDVSLPDRRLLQTELLSNTETVISYSKPILINGQGQELDSFVAPEFALDPKPEKDLEQLFHFGNYICAPSVAIRKKDFISFGGFKVNLDALQDYAMWLQAADLGLITPTSTPIVKYRKHNSNLSRSDYLNDFSHRRHRAELPIVLSDFLNKISNSGLQKLISAGNIENDLATRSLSISFVKMSHPERLVRLEGVRDLLNLSMSGELDEASFYLVNQKINEVLSFTDPDNKVALREMLLNLKNLDADLQHIWEGGGA